MLPDIVLSGILFCFETNLIYPNLSQYVSEEDDFLSFKGLGLRECTTMAALSDHAIKPRTSYIQGRSSTK